MEWSQPRVSHRGYVCYVCNLTEGRRGFRVSEIVGGLNLARISRSIPRSNDSKNSLLLLFWGQAYLSVTEGDD